MFQFVKIKLCGTLRDTWYLKLQGGTKIFKDSREVEWDFLPSLGARIFGFASTMLMDHGNYPNVDSDKLGLLTALSKINAPYIDIDKIDPSITFYVDECGRFFTNSDCVEVVETLNSSKPYWPVIPGSIIVCENSSMFHDYQMDILKKAYPDAPNVKVMYLFRWRTLEEVEYAFRLASGVFFDTSFSEMDWVTHMINAARKAPGIKIKGCSDNSAGWRNARLLAKVFGIEIEQLG